MAIKSFDDMMDRIIEEVLKNASEELGLEVEESVKAISDRADQGLHDKELVAMFLISVAQEVVNGNVSSFRLNWDGEKLELDNVIKINHPKNYMKIDLDTEEKVEDKEK